MMQLKKSEEFEILEGTIIKQTKITSQNHISQYLTYLGYTDLSEYEKEKANALQSLQASQDFQVNQPFDPNICLKITAHSPNKEFVEIKATLGNFILKNIIIAIFETESLTHNVTESYSGNFCTTFRANCFGKQSAFKCFPLIQKNQQSLNVQQIRYKRVAAIKSAIKKYCITLVASELKIGLKVEKILGYDIAIYKNCVEFAMEFCLQSKEIPASVEFEKQAKAALKTAHSFRLIHYDIKPENICFSPKQNRVVFIDFGLSEFSSVQLGEMQETSFKGSFSYVGEQMARLFNDQRTGWVDLFYNDLHSLKKSVAEYKDIKLLNKIQKQTNFKKQNKSKSIDYIKINDLTDYHLVKKMKFLLLQGRKQSFLELWLDQRYQKIVRFSQRKVVEFIFSLKYTEQFSSFEGLFNNNSQKQQALSVQQSLVNFKNYNDWSKKDKLKQSSIIETFKDLLEIASFRQNCKQYQKVFKNEVDYLLGFNKIANTQLYKKEKYFVCLAKALQINTDKYSFALRKQFASVALSSFFKQNTQRQTSHQNIQPKNGEEDSDFAALKSVSHCLFDYSFSEPFSKAKLQIYAAIIVNVVVLKAVSQQQLFDYYVRVHSLQASFQMKLRMVLKFVTTFEWMIYTIQSKQNYFKHIKKYRDYSSVFLKQIEQKGYKHWQTYLYWFITQVSQIDFYQIAFNRLPQQLKKNLKEYLDNETNIKSVDFKKQILRWEAYVKAIVYQVQFNGTSYYASLIRKSVLQVQKQFDYFFFAILFSELSHNMSPKLALFFKNIFSDNKIHDQYCVSSLQQITNFLYMPSTQFQKNIPLLEQRIPQLKSLNLVYLVYFSQPVHLENNQKFKTNYFLFLNLLFSSMLDLDLRDIRDFFYQKHYNFYSITNYSTYVLACFGQLYTNQAKQQSLNLAIPAYKTQKEFQKRHKQKIKTMDQIICNLFSLGQIIAVLKLHNSEQSNKRILQLCSVMMRLVYTLRHSILKNNIKNDCLQLVQTAIVGTNLSEPYKIDQNSILIYNIFLEYQPKFVELLGLNTLFYKFLLVIQKHEGVQRMVDFYNLQINQFMEIQVKTGRTLYLLANCAHIMQAVSVNSQQMVRLLRKVQQQIGSNPSLFLLICSIFDRSPLAKKPTNYKRILKGLNSIPIVLRKLCIRIMYSAFLLNFFKYLPSRRVIYLTRRQLKFQMYEWQKMGPCTVSEWTLKKLQSNKNRIFKRYTALIEQKIGKIKIRKRIQ